MRKYLILAMALGWGMSNTHSLMANGPAETIVESEQVLSELMAIPGKQIPQRLLDEAQGIVVVPNVIKIGFIAGARRGHGIVMVRDPDGEWSLPQFVTLTGGSVGWQAGIQGTDVVLVFTTRKGVEGLMQGKFTVGVDASATAGPVGREAAVGTDTTLRSEIYSYSRSRGLFVGVSLDGSALEIDHGAHAYFYGTPTAELPSRVPPSATQLRHFLGDMTPGHQQAPSGIERAVPEMSPRRLDVLRRSLNQSAGQLQAILTPEWRPYLAMPREIHEPGAQPSLESLALVQRRFDHINSSGEYRQLVQHPAFQTTYELLREYERALAGTRQTLQLPPPPLHMHRE
jgi:lipid-binding SYLF domain-containing protein